MTAESLALVIYADELGYYVGDAAKIATMVDALVVDVIGGSVWHSVVKEGSGITLINAKDVQEVWQALRGIRQLYQERGGQMVDQTIYMLMPCGEGVRYCGFDDIPWQDTYCPCGDPKHRLIRYYGGQVQERARAA